MQDLKQRSNFLLDRGVKLLVACVERFHNGTGSFVRAIVFGHPVFPVDS